MHAARSCAPRPQHGRRVGGHDRRHRGPPRSGADHRDPCHAVLRCVSAVSGSRHHHSSSSRGHGRVDLTGARDTIDDGGHHAIGRLLHVLVRARARCGSPITAVCATPHCQCGLRPLVRIRWVPHRPTGVIAGSGTVREARGARLRRPSVRGPAEIVPSGNTPMHSPRSSASTASAARRRRRPGRAARGSGARPAAADRARACRRARPWRGSERAGRGGRRPTRASADRDTRRGCSRARPVPDVGMLCSPSIVQCRPHRNQGENTPFATEYTGSTLGSIRRPCRAGAFPNCRRRRAVAIVCARQGSPRRRARRRRAPRVHTRDGGTVDRRGRTPSGRRRLERTRGRRVGGRARPRRRRRPRLTRRRRGRGPEVGSGARPRPRRGDARGSSARDHPRRSRRRRRRPGCRDRSRSSRRRQSRARDPERCRLRVRVRTGFVRAPHRRGATLRPRGAHRPRPRARLRRRRRRRSRALAHERETTP